MSTMGKHSPPLDGTVANGRALAPFTLPLMPRGPVSVLPRPTARPARWHDIDGDTAIRVLAAAVVLAVAAFAAIVSYSHIFELGRHHGQDGTAARLLPLSVDGLIAAASLVMLHAARRSQDVPWLARAMLALGVAATVAANVLYGLPFGWLAAVVSAWPAVAFVGSVEMAVRFVRDARQGATADQPGADKPADKALDKQTDKTLDKPVPRRAIPGTRPRTTQLDKATAAIARHPDWTDTALARSAGVSAKTVHRARNAKTGSTR